MKNTRHQRRSGFTLRLAAIMLISLLSLPAGAQTPQADTPLTVFAAASLKESMDEVAAAYQAASGIPVRVSYAGSSALARQIEQGAPADVFFSADLTWMDYLQEHGKVSATQRHNLLGNQLVLVAPSSRPLTVDPSVAGSIAKALGKQRLAVGLTKSVPAGKYARQALESIGQWASVKDQLAEAENVRAALMLVARGEVPLGIVYLSDAKAQPAVSVAGVFAEGSHRPIIYPVAALNGAHTAGAEKLVAWLNSAEARAIFQRRGFEVLAQDSQAQP